MTSTLKIAQGSKSNKKKKLLNFSLFENLWNTSLDFIKLVDRILELYIRSHNYVFMFI